MAEKSNNQAGVEKMSAAIRAKDMICVVGGMRGWTDTRESWLARVGRKIGMSPRRVRAIFYGEPIRLSADEYLAIERVYLSANHALASLSHLSRDANVSAGVADAARGGSPEGEG